MGQAIRTGLTVKIFDFWTLLDEEHQIHPVNTPLPRENTSQNQLRFEAA